MAKASKLERAKTLWAMYESRKVKGIEPDWILGPFKGVKRYVDGSITDADEKKEVESNIEDLSIPNGYVCETFFGRRIFEDGFKIGTKSWAFMGRNIEGAVHPLTDDLVAIRRKLPTQGYPSETRMIYHKKVDPALLCIGPCDSMGQALAWVSQEFSDEKVQRYLTVMRATH